MPLEKKRGSRPPPRGPVERKRHSKHDESSPEGDRAPHSEPDELNPCAHRDTCGEPPPEETDKNPSLDD